MKSWLFVYTANKSPVIPLGLVKLYNSVKSVDV